VQDFLPAGRNSGPRSLEYQAAHFTLHYFASSPAERDIRLLAARLDAMHDALTASLGLQGKLQMRTDVHLVDAEDEDWVNGRPPTAEDADIYFIYRADTPAEELERAYRTPALRGGWRTSWPALSPVRWTVRLSERAGTGT
jgi:hypothetical protein